MIYLTLKFLLFMKFEQNFSTVEVDVDFSFVAVYLLDKQSRRFPVHFDYAFYACRINNKYISRKLQHCV